MLPHTCYRNLRYQLFGFSIDSRTFHIFIENNEILYDFEFKLFVLT